MYSFASSLNVTLTSAKGEPVSLPTTSDSLCTVPFNSVIPVMIDCEPLLSVITLLSEDKLYVIPLTVSLVQVVPLSIKLLFTGIVN